MDYEAAPVCQQPCGEELFKRKLLIFSRATINSTYKSKNHENEQNSYVEVLRCAIIAILNETNI